MCDLYLKYTICEKVDIWMLGCILYTMCFYKHPFAECSKLAIVNAAFSISDDGDYSKKLKDLMRIMLTPDPQLRPSIFTISEYFNSYDTIKSIELNVTFIHIKKLIIN